MLKIERILHSLDYVNKQPCGYGWGGGGDVFQGAGEIQLPQTPHLVDVVVDEVEELAVVHDADVAGVLAEDLGGEVGAGHQQQLQRALPVVEDGPVDGRRVAAEGKGDKHCSVDRWRGSGNRLGLGVGAWGVDTGLLMGGDQTTNTHLSSTRSRQPLSHVNRSRSLPHSHVTDQVQTTNTLTCHQPGPDNHSHLSSTRSRQPLSLVINQVQTTTLTCHQPGPDHYHTHSLSTRSRPPTHSLVIAQVKTTTTLTCHQPGPDHYHTHMSLTRSRPPTHSLVINQVETTTTLICHGPGPDNHSRLSSTRSRSLPHGHHPS